MVKSKKIDLAASVARRAGKAMDPLAERLPSSAAAEPTIYLTSDSDVAPVQEVPDSAIRVRRIERVSVPVRVSSELSTQLEELMAGKKRGLWIEHRCAEMFDELDERALLQLIVDGVEKEMDDEASLLGGKVMAARIDVELVRRFDEAARSVRTDRSKVLRAWLSEVVRRETPPRSAEA